jgi:FkbM family methyltransferase
MMRPILIYSQKYVIITSILKRGLTMFLWNYLSKTDKTVVMYGMGNGADKILSVCNEYGIEIADFFASDSFVRGQLFHGKRVLKFSEIIDKYGADNVIVIVAFASSLPDVMQQIVSVGKICETYVPDVPVKGVEIFNEEFEAKYASEIEKAFSLLADERSKEVYRGVWNFRRSGRLEDLLSTSDDRDEVMRSLLNLKEFRVAIDAGAYDGDTAGELIELCPDIEKIFAFEPDRRNFRKLSSFAEDNPSVIAINAAVWKENTTLIFDDSGNRNAGIDADGKAKRQAEVKAASIDSLCAERVDYIKYDVEGAEEEALLGSSETIRKYRPVLLISAYHKTADLFKLILLVHAICPEYRFYLRRYPYIPAWDLNLIATAREI